MALLHGVAGCRLNLERSQLPLQAMQASKQTKKQQTSGQAKARRPSSSSSSTADLAPPMQAAVKQPQEQQLG